MEIFLVVSLLLHLLFLFLFSAGISLPVAKKPPELEVILQRPYQIADIAPPLKEERPDKAKFAGLYDSRVEEEKVAVSPPQVQSTPSKPAGEKQQERPVRDKARGDSPRAKKGELAMKSPTEEESLEEKLKRAGAAELEIPEDFYPNTKVGDHTYLNVLRFPNVSYFVRLKKIFKTTFNPVAALRASSFQISRGQIEVVLGVAVDRGGQLAKLFVIRSSGVSDYDQEALRTIRDSAPFSAPPEEFLDPEGQLRMSWTFTVYL
ncbi:MAG: energy transducer TonB [Deltaproteobacteria bacterium]|nr:energy transducer TonB [Deltaproteobacteria bacterium]